MDTNIMYNQFETHITGIRKSRRISSAKQNLQIQNYNKLHLLITNKAYYNTIINEERTSSAWLMEAHEGRITFFIVRDTVDYMRITYRHRLFVTQ